MVVTDNLQQEDITKMDHPAQSFDYKSVHLWNELGCTISNMDHPANTVHELRQALLDHWANISVERLQHLVPSMPRRQLTIIVVRGGNIRW